MKVLWVSNIIFPEVCNELHMTPPVVGGWMYASALALLENNPHLDLAVASLYSGKELKIVTNYKIQYYLIPKELSYLFCFLIKKIPFTHCCISLLVIILNGSEKQTPKNMIFIMKKVSNKGFSQMKLHVHRKAVYIPIPFIYILLLLYIAIFRSKRKIQRIQNG